VDEKNLTHVAWSIYSNSTNSTYDYLSTDYLNSQGGVIHMSPVGKNDLILVPANKVLSALDAGDGSNGRIKWDYTFNTRIVDIYVAPGTPSIASEDYIYIRTLDRYVTALHHSTGIVAWKYQAGTSTFSHPIRSSDHATGSHPTDLYYVQSTDGTTHALHCPTESHIVLDRLVYVCPALTLVRPTSKDLCMELESPCVIAAGNDPTLRPPTYWTGRAKTDNYPQQWLQEKGVGNYIFTDHGGTGLYGAP
jgi:hypothetical protein